jgi:GTPase SAR1 family protein
MLILRCKLALIGTPAAGKTALTQVFCKGAAGFPKAYVMTLGCELTVKEVRIPDTNACVELYIHDVGGQRIYENQQTVYLDPPPAFYLLCYDHNPDSFDYVSKWIESHSEDVAAAVLVATKSDAHERHLRQGQDLAEQYGMPFFATSAAQVRDVDAPFNYCSQAFYQIYEDWLQATSQIKTAP